MINLAVAIKRFEWRLIRALAFAIRAFNVVGLDFRGIVQNQTRQFFCGIRAVNRPFETGFDQQRQPTGMVEVRVRNQDGIQIFRGETLRHTIFLIRMCAVKHAEIHQHASAVGFHKIGRAGHFPSRAVNSNFHLDKSRVAQASSKFIRLSRGNLSGLDVFTRRHTCR